MKPGATAAENPHHFVVIQVDGDRLSLQAIGTGETEYSLCRRTFPKIDLNDK